jgi:hypothetical protein
MPQVGFEPTILVFERAKTLQCNGSVSVVMFKKENETMKLSFLEWASLN